MCDSYKNRYDSFMAKNILEEIISNGYCGDLKNESEKDYVKLSLKAVVKNDYLVESISSSINTYEELVKQLSFYID